MELAPHHGPTHTHRETVELVATVLLAAAAVLTAWAAFESAKWSGLMAIHFNEASAARTESAKALSVGSTEENVDVTAFLQWLSAHQREEIAGIGTVIQNGRYVPNPEELTGFLHSRFRDEFIPAFDAWIATDPFNNLDAPKTPFEMPEYRNESIARSGELDRMADEKTSDARSANKHSDNYVLMTVLFAMGLFFAGISSKLPDLRSMAITVTISFVVIVVAAIIVATFPVRIT